MSDPVILWFRQDLRLHDQPALVAAAREGPVIPVYVLDDETPSKWRMGAAQRWWLHHSLESLGAALRKPGSKLIVRRGRADRVLRELLDQTGAQHIHALRHDEPWWRAIENELGDRLCLHDGQHLVPLDQVTTGAGKLFRVYSAFWRALSAKLPPEAPIAPPRHLDAPAHWPKSEALASWKLLPTKPNWAKAFADAWTPGEDEARRQAAAWQRRVGDYEARRNLPADEDGTSHLSPHLHFGELSPRDLYYRLHGAKHADKFFKELAWRDFTSGVTIALPDYADANGRERFDRLPWRTGAAATCDLTAWQTGRTGYPIVDAGMRQLWAIGWMHNRVRMITASFLVKHLLIDWREGERWFWDCLVDADYGNNSVNWQWVAGTGVDANMFGRIMAPLTQSAKFDAGDYIRRWVPELADVPDPVIHDPDEAGRRPAAYPAKIIGHREGRERALAALRE